MKKAFVVILLFINFAAFAQQDSSDYIYLVQKFQQAYVANHDVVKGSDKVFLTFFPINSTYHVTAVFKRIKDNTGFAMETSEGKTARYFKYGKVTFKLQNKTCQLFVYQSERLMKIPEYKNHLFIPFIDPTNGFTSYGGGRYLDVDITNIQNNKVELDFNKAYNPSCAYVEGYSCPLPPRENTMSVPVIAGEKIYGKPIH